MPSEDSSANTNISPIKELVTGYALNIPTADVAVPKPTRSQPQPPNMEPAGPVGESHRDLTITDSTPYCKEHRFALSFTFPTTPGVDPPRPAVPQKQPCAVCVCMTTGRSRSSCGWPVGIRRLARGSWPRWSSRIPGGSSLRPKNSVVLNPAIDA